MVLLLPNSLVGLFHHCLCPPARDLGSRVSGLFLTFTFMGGFCINAPAQIYVLCFSHVYLFSMPTYVLFCFFSRVLCDSTPCFVGPSVRHTLVLWHLWGFWLCCACPFAPLTSNIAPSHLHATGVAVYMYPALLSSFFLFHSFILSFYFSIFFFLRGHISHFWVGRSISPCVTKLF